MSLQHGSDTLKPHNRPQANACGSIIDAQGREIEITEQMIQRACNDLEASRAQKAREDNARIS
ncbi:PA1571 family protein [Pseudomonas sp. URMO17WK12:I11]|uniref:PA1571 family protein n=1 Tax=Pseudomonas sp. URMO17WK12:I11 TaxID=1283291 RepID=UPI0011A34197|nr:PA1571 family protein [Pseudomonas sp. URMO17WK12:I11]